MRWVEVDRRKYTRFLLTLISFIFKSNIMFLFLSSSIFIIIITLFTGSCGPARAVDMALFVLAVPAGIVLHEAAHFALLDTRVKVWFDGAFIALEARGVPRSRLLASAVAGPSAPAALGAVLWLLAPPSSLVAPHVPLLAHLATLPLESAGVLGVRLIEPEEG